MVTGNGKIDNWKATAQIFLENKIPTFIRDANSDLYFGYVTEAQELYILIKCFGPKQRANQTFKVYWTLITDLAEYETENKEETHQ